MTVSNCLNAWAVSVSAATDWTVPTVLKPLSTKFNFALCVGAKATTASVFKILPNTNVLPLPPTPSSATRRRFSCLIQLIKSVCSPIGSKSVTLSRNGNCASVVLASALRTNRSSASFAFKYNKPDCSSSLIKPNSGDCINSSERKRCRSETGSTSPLAFSITRSSTAAKCFNT